MTATFDRLKEKLKQQGSLSDEEIQKAVDEGEALEPDERMWLEAERLELAKAKKPQITMDEYLAALKVLDEAEEGSDEYNKAEKLVDAYESGG